MAVMHNVKRFIRENRVSRAGENMVGGEPGRRPHRHLRRDTPFPYSTQIDGPDSDITLCLDYIQMRR